MTYTEAAVEILRRSGSPLHFKEIATRAVEAGLLSHVGQSPEATMGVRLLAMARREADRRVIAVDSGVFALAEWGLAPAAVPDKDESGEPGSDEGAPYRARERHPPLQEELVVGGRRDERRRRSETDEEGRKKRRFPPPAEVAHPWLLAHGAVGTLAELAAGLRAAEQLAPALERDLESLGKALREENRRRADSGRAPLFAFEDDGRVRALEAAAPAPREEPREKREPRPEKPERREPPRPVPAAGADEQRRAVLRAVRRRLAGLDTAAIERVAVAVLEAQGYREINMARRSGREGPLYLARHRWGAGELRYAVRILGPGRDLGRPEVQEVRRELAHYSAQIGVLVCVGECSRDAKSEANVPNLAPVLLYGNEALAEALLESGLGVQKRIVEWLEYDDAFFTAAGAAERLPESEPAPEAPVRDEARPESAESAPAEEEPARPEGEEAPAREGERRRRERRRDARAGRAAETASPEGAGTPESAGAPESAIATDRSAIPDAPAPVAAEASAAASEPAQAPPVPAGTAVPPPAEAPARAEAAEPAPPSADAPAAEAGEDAPARG